MGQRQKLGIKEKNIRFAIKSNYNRSKKSGRYS